MKKKKLTNLFDEFINEQRYTRKIRPATLKGYESSFNLFVKVMPHIKYPGQLTPAVMTEYFTKLHTRERVVGNGKIKKGIKDSTVGTYWAKLGKFFNWLEMREYFKINPLSLMDRPIVDYTDRKYLEKEDVEKIFSHVSYHINWRTSLLRSRNIALFTVALCCGLRKSELIKLNLLDVNLKNRTLTIRKEITKSRQSRVIPLNNLVCEKLKDYLSERSKAGHTGNWLWCSDNTGNRFTVYGLNHLVKKVEEHAEVDFHMHRFRHTFAINLVGNNVPAPKIQQLMGHKDIRMTAAYSRCIPADEMRADVELINCSDLL